MASAIVGSVTPLPRHSEEFSRLDHLLQVSCRSTEVRDVSAWTISNTQLSAAFERKSTGLLTIDCWLDISSLDEHNPVQEVCKRGFFMPESREGLPFTTGNIAFDLEGPDAHQYLLCTVAVGRSYVQDDPAARREQPSGYDSLYLHLPGLSGGASGGSGDGAAAGDLTSGDAYRHTYVVFDSAQVLPRYVVHFLYHPRERLARQPVKPINLAEIKARVADALSLLGPAAPAATEKMLSDIGDAYEAAINSSSSGDPLLEERKRGIRDVLRAVDDKLAAVQANSAAVEEALYAKLQAALSQLQAETQRKMNLLLSEELELRRQLQQVEWAESFVGVMQTSLPPMSFVSAWERHAALRSQLYAQLSGGGGLSARVLDEVQPDMRLAGAIDVTTDRATAAAAFASAAATAAAAGYGAGRGLGATAAYGGGLGGATAALLAATGRGGDGAFAGQQQQPQFTPQQAQALAALAAAAGGGPGAAGSGGEAAAAAADPSAVNTLLTSLLRDSMGLQALSQAPKEQQKAAAPPPHQQLHRYREAEAEEHQHHHHRRHEPTPAAAPYQQLPQQQQQQHAAALVPVPPPQRASPPGPAPVPASVAAAQAALAAAKGDLAALERALQGTPFGTAARAHADLARAEAQARVAEAEAGYAARVREEAQVYLSRAPAPAASAAAEVVEAEEPSPRVRHGLAASAFLAAPAPAALPPPALTNEAGTIHATYAAASGSSSPVAAAAAATIGGAGGAAVSPSRAFDAEERRGVHSLTAEADRKRRVYGLEDGPDPSLAFPATRVLTPAEASRLYLCLPFGAAEDGSGAPAALPPITKLIWATYDGSHTVQSLYNAYTQLGGGEPTVMLIKATNGAVFGAYCADPWTFDDQYGGTPRSFLFSLTRDVKIPYTGRQRGPRQVSDDLLRQEQEAAHAEELEAYLGLEEEMAAANGGVAPYDDRGRLIVVEEDEAGRAVHTVLARPHPRPFVRCDAMRSNARLLQLGVRDLVLADDFRVCTSELEWSYGIGLKVGSPEARSLLAGTHEFVPAVIEVWTVAGEAGASLADATTVLTASEAGAGSYADGASGVGGGSRLGSYAGGGGTGTVASSYY